MDTIARRIGGNLRSYNVYSVEEAQAEGIHYKVDWRECIGGTFGLSDDGFVAECIQKLEYTDKRQRVKSMYVFPYARIWGRSRGRLEYLPRKASGNFHTVSNKSWLEREVRLTRTRNAIKVYVAQLLNGGRPNLEEVGRVYRPDVGDPVKTIKKLLKQDRIQLMIDEEIRKILESKGITKDVILENYIESFKKAKEEGDAGNMVKANDRLAGYLDMLPTKSAPTQLQIPEGDIEKLSETLLAAEETRRRLTGAVPAPQQLPS